MSLQEELKLQNTTRKAKLWIEFVRGSGGAYHGTAVSHAHREEEQRRLL